MFHKYLLDMQAAVYQLMMPGCCRLTNYQVGSFLNFTHEALDGPLDAEPELRAKVIEQLQDMLLLSWLSSLLRLCCTFVCVAD